MYKDKVFSRLSVFEFGGYQKSCLPTFPQLLVILTSVFSVLSLSRHEFEQTLGDSEEQESLHAAVHGLQNSRTQLSD